MTSGGNVLAMVRRQRAEGRGEKTKRGRSIRSDPLLPSAFCLLISFDECHLVDLTQRGAPFQHFLQRRLAEESHSFLVGRFLDLRCRAAVENHAANTIGEVEK